MSRRLATAIVAPLVALAALAAAPASPASAHDRPGSPPPPRSGKLALACRPQAGPPAQVTCRWSASGRPASLRYELFRKTLGSPGRPAVIATTTERSHVDTDVAPGTRYAYKVRALDAASGAAVARSRVVVVRCCDPGHPGPADDRRPEPGDARPKPGEGPRPDRPADKPVGEPTRFKPLSLQCAPAPAPAPGAAAVGCQWSGLPADKVAGYRLWRKVAGGTPVVIATFPGGGTTTHTDTTVTPGSTYWYAVEAKAADGHSTRSNIVEVHCC